MLGGLLTVAAAAANTAAAAKQPHILMILVDDLGHAELGYHRPPAYKEVVTPEIDELVRTGAQLDRFYVHKFCSPTRCAIQTGRAPIHVNVINAAPEVHNASDPISGFAGIPRNMTGVAEVMRRAGYSTHYAGKWDTGMATPDHTPAGRGYDSSLFYFHHSNDYWTFRDGASCKPDEGVALGMGGTIDLWNDPPYSVPAHMPPIGRPAKEYVNSPGCTDSSQNVSGTCVYEDQLFEDRIHRVPDAYFDRFETFVDNPQRAKYHSMVSWIDGAVGRVVQSLRDEGLYNDTLICMNSDNGGPLPSGNNFPLKGGKFSNWEGGIRVNAFVGGGFLPEAVRGTVISGLMTGWDWFATWAHLAGVDDITDRKAALAHLPQPDSINMWPMLSGASSSSPRSQVVVGSNIGGDESGRTSGVTTIAALIRPPWKLLLGEGPGDILDMAGHPGPLSPNNSATVDWKNVTQVCGRTPSTGCLYNVYEDPEERHNLAAQQPELYGTMMAAIKELNQGVFSPSRGVDDGVACKQVEVNGGFWGPFVFP